LHQFRGKRIQHNIVRVSYFNGRSRLRQRVEELVSLGLSRQEAMREVVLEISRARAALLSSRQTASSLAESQTAHDLPHAAIGVAPSMGVPPGESPGPLGHLDDEESDSEGELATAIQASLEEVEGRGSEPSASGTSEPAIPRGSLFSAHLESAHDHRM